MRKESEDAASLLTEVYGKPFTAEMFEGKYFLNPDELPRPIRFVTAGELGSDTDTEKPAGIIALMGMRVVQGAVTGSGTVHLIGQAADAVTLKEYRGLGGFSKIFRNWENEDTGAEFIIGLPNPNSFPRLLHLGYHEISWLHHYLRIRAPFSLVFGRNPLSAILDAIWSIPSAVRSITGRSAASPRSRIRAITEDPLVFDDPPFDDDDYTAINRCADCRFIRSDEYYRWKQSYNGDIHFRYVVLRKKKDDETVFAREIRDELAAFMVYHIRPLKRGHVLVIDDWGVTDRLARPVPVADPPGSGKLPHDAAAFDKEDLTVYTSVLEYMAEAVPEPYELVEMPLVNPNLAEPAILNRLHFLNICRLPLGARGSPLIASPRAGKDCFVKYSAFRHLDSDVLS